MIQVYLIAGAVAVAVAFASGWKVRAWKADSDQAEQIAAANRTALLRQRQADSASEDYEKRIASARARERVITREVDRVVEKPVYRNVCVDADGLRLIADAIAAADPAASQPAPALPASGTAK